MVSTDAKMMPEPAYCSELRITVRVVDNRTEVEIISLPAIDRAHALKPVCKRDKRYARAARKAA